MDVEWPPVKPLSDAALVSRNLSVDVYYVNVGEGDCAIYYLVEYPPPGHPGKKIPYVHRACLIDGGKPPGAGAIWKFLTTRVPDMYHWDRTQGGRDPEEVPFPPFDSIVITHWDLGRLHPAFV